MLTTSSRPIILRQESPRARPSITPDRTTGTKHSQRHSGTCGGRRRSRRRARGWQQQRRRQRRATRHAPAALRSMCTKKLVCVRPWVTRLIVLNGGIIRGAPRKGLAERRTGMAGKRLGLIKLLRQATQSHKEQRKGRGDDKKIGNTKGIRLTMGINIVEALQRNERFGKWWQRWRDSG